MSNPIITQIEVDGVLYDINTPLAQGTGSSDTLAMSQKAVTENLDAALEPFETVGGHNLLDPANTAKGYFSANVGGEFTPTAHVNQVRTVNFIPIPSGATIIYLKTTFDASQYDEVARYIYIGFADENGVCLKTSSQPIEDLSRLEIPKGATQFHFWTLGGKPSIPLTADMFCIATVNDEFEEYGAKKTPTKIKAEYLPASDETELPIVQNVGTSETDIMSQKATTDELKKIRTSNNLFADTVFVEGYFYNGSQSASATYNYFKNVYLPVGTYRCTKRIRFLYNVTAATLTAESIEPKVDFTIETAGFYNITVYSSDTNYKLHSTDYQTDEVLSLGKYTFNEEKITIPSLQVIAERVDTNDTKTDKIITTKNIFSDKKFVEGHYCTWFESSGKYIVSAANYNYFDNIVLAPGTYTVYPRARFVVNLTAGENVIEVGKEFTVTETSEYAITVYAADSNYKLYKSEYDATEVEALGEYTLGEDIRLPAGVGNSGNILAGKKWCVVGDSFTNHFSGNFDADWYFTEGNFIGKSKVYGYLIADRNNMRIQWMAEGGRTLATPADGTFTNTFSDTLYTQIDSDVDYITIMLGINDGHHNSTLQGTDDGEDTSGDIPLGTASDTTTATFYGAWNVVLPYLMEHHPNAHIGIIVSNGLDDISYRTATIEMAKKYGIPYIDLNGDERTQAMHRAQNENLPQSVKNILLEKYSISTEADSYNTHPNKLAHSIESSIVENFLRSI